MMKQLVICLIIGIVFVGCSQVPKPASYKWANQKKMQAAEHWRIFAKDISSQVLNQIKIEGADSDSLTFIPNNNSSFCRGFRSFLGTEFTKSQIQLISPDDAGYQLDWSVQVLQHKASRVEPSLPKNTIIASLGYGVYKLFDDSTEAAAAIGTGVALDILEHVYDNGSVKLPHNEIIINLTLKKNDKISYRSSNIYYVNDLDVDHYHTSKDNLGIDKEFNGKTYTISN